MSESMLLTEEAQLLIEEGQKATLTLKDLIDSTPKVLPDAVNSGRSILIENFKQVVMKGTQSHQFSCQTRSVDSDSHYNTQITIYKVVDGQKPHYAKNPCRVFCSCQAYYFYFSYANWKADCHLGRKARPYTPVPNPKRHVPPRNPDNVPGMCKHLVGLTLALSDSGYVDR